MTESSQGLAQLPAAARDRAGSDLDRLLGYVRHETPTGNRAALDRFAQVLIADAAASGATSRTLPLPDGDALVMEHPGRGRDGQEPALVLAHYDTVHPVGSLDGAVPLRRDGDTLYGPGTYDMKGGIVVVLAALELLGELGLPHRPVRVVVTPDEEVGSPTSRDVVTDQARGVAFALGLEPPHADGALKTSRMGSTRLRLSVAGRSAHAALNPELGVSATDELVDQLLRTRALIGEHPEVLCNVGSLGGEGRTNVVASAAHADLGLRFTTLQTEREVLARLAALDPVREGARISTSVLSSRPAWGPATATDELLARVVTAAAAVGQQLSGRAASGAADTNLTGAMGVPSLDGFGPTGGGAHAVDERISVGSLPERVALMAAVLHGA